jgi:hypothetical protein
MVEYQVSASVRIETSKKLASMSLYPYGTGVSASVRIETLLFPIP